MKIQDAQEHLKKYVSEKLSNFVPANFEEGVDIPSFAVDQLTAPLGAPPYSN
jgi:hypothetical protein